MEPKMKLTADGKKVVAPVIGKVRTIELVGQQLDLKGEPIGAISFPPEEYEVIEIGTFNNRGLKYFVTNKVLEIYDDGSVETQVLHQSFVAEFIPAGGRE